MQEAEMRYSGREFLDIRLELALNRLWAERFGPAEQPAPWVFGLFRNALRAAVERGGDVDTVVAEAIEEALVLMHSYGHELPARALTLVR